MKFDPSNTLTLQTFSLLTPYQRALYLAQRGIRTMATHEKEINEARIQAMEDYQTQLAEKHDVFETQRFQMMEGAIADLQKRLQEIEGK